MRQIGVGIIGTGWCGGIRAEACAAHPLVRSLHLAEIRPERRAEVAKATGAASVTGDYRALLGNREIEGIYISATPETTHYPMARDCLAAGKHVFLEKPMGLDKAQCRQMLDAANAAGITLTVGQVTRRMEAPRLAKEMVDNGEIGDVRMIETWRGQADGTGLGPDHWAANRGEGGAFLDWGSHGCDVTRWYAGAEPVLAFGQTTEFDPKNQWQSSTMAQFRFANGAMAQIWMTYELPHAAIGTRARYLLVGSKAILDIAAYGQIRRSRADGGWDVVYQSDDFKGADAGWGYPSIYMRQAFARQVQDFTNAIADGTSLSVTGEDGLRAVEMVEAATRSAETGQAVRLPLT
jgi:predicted dehydrogenase